MARLGIDSFDVAVAGTAAALLWYAANDQVAKSCIVPIVGLGLGKLGKFCKSMQLTDVANIIVAVSRVVLPGTFVGSLVHSGTRAVGCPELLSQSAALVSGYMVSWGAVMLFLVDRLAKSGRPHAF